MPRFIASYLPKRIALFILGVALAIGAFLLYQHLTGTEIERPGGLRGLATGPATTLPPSFEQRDEQGNLELLVTAEKSPEQMRDDRGDPLPGQFRLESPVATFFHKSGRILEIHAQTCEFAIEQGPAGGGLSALMGGASGGGRKAVDRINLRMGRLSGNVRMRVSGLPPDAQAGNDPIPEGLLVHFDGDLEYDGAKGILSSSDTVRVRSAVWDGDYRGLRLAVGRDSSKPRNEWRIEYLRIEPHAAGNRMILKGVAGRIAAVNAPAAAPATPSAAAPGTATPAPGGVASQPLAAVEPASFYRLNFGQDIEVHLGSTTISSTWLQLVFAASRDLVGQTLAEDPPAARTTMTQTAPAAVTPLGPIVPQSLPPLPQEATPIAQPTADDLVVTWTGPLELRPMDDPQVQLGGPNDVLLEATGTKDTPVVIKDPRFEAMPGRLKYQSNTPVWLLKGDRDQVVLRDLSDGKVRTEIVSGDVMIDQARELVQIAGPATATSTDSRGDKTTLSWQSRGDFALADLVAANDPDKRSTVIRKASLPGAVIKAPTFDLSTDQLDVVIDNIVAGGRTTPVLEHLLAAGRVKVKSYRRDGSGEQGGLETDRMEILTAKEPDGNRAPSQLLAAGQVVGWRFSESGRGLGSVGITVTPAGAAAMPRPATAPVAGVGSPAAVPGAPREYQRERVATARLVADLRPRTRTGPAAALVPANPSTDPAYGDLMQDIEVTRFAAFDGVSVEITPPPSAPNAALIVATARTIDALPPANTATLSGLQGQPARVTVGHNTLEGAEILLDGTAGKEWFEIPGTGRAVLQLPDDDKGARPAPLEITFGKMKYDHARLLAEFPGDVTVQTQGANRPQDASSNLGRLKASEFLNVHLAQATGGALVLDWIHAKGNVDAGGAQVDAQGKVLTSMNLKTAELRYTEANNRIDVPGAGTIVVIDNRPDKPESRENRQGTYALDWKGSLTYDPGSITLNDQVRFLFLPVRPFPIAAALGRNAATQPVEPRPDPAQLLAGEVVVNLAVPTAGAVNAASPVGLGENVTRAIARSGAEMTISDFRLAGSTIDFDVAANRVVVSGEGENPAVASRSGMGRNTADSIELDMANETLDLKMRNPRGMIVDLGGN